MGGSFYTSPSVRAQVPVPAGSTYIFAGCYQVGNSTCLDTVPPTSGNTILKCADDITNLLYSVAPAGRGPVISPNGRPHHRRRCAGARTKSRDGAGPLVRRGARRLRRGHPHRSGGGSGSWRRPPGLPLSPRSFHVMFDDLWQRAPDLDPAAFPNDLPQSLLRQRECRVGPASTGAPSAGKNCRTTP
jgi:hypothetical protein